MTARALGFDRPMANSLDAVSDRDFALEALAAAAICARPPLAAGRGDRALDRRRSSASCSCPTPSPPARRSCRRSATPTPPSWCAPRPAASWAPSPALTVVMKGLPLAYSQGHAGGQGPGLRGVRRAGAGAGGHDRHGRRPRRRTTRAHGRRGRRGLLHRHRPRRLAGARAGPAVPRGAPRDRRGGEAGRGAGRRTWPTCRWPSCRRSNRASPRTFTRC